MENISRTDLALERKEDVKEEALKGVIVETQNRKGKDIEKTTIIIENEEGEKALGKPKGTYITIESESLREFDEEYHNELSEELRETLKSLLGGTKEILVVGLGNRQITPDALGPFVVDNLFITRHLNREGILNTYYDISAIAPGVMAQTGIETGEIIKGVLKESKAKALIVIDALAARNTERLNKTIQISDAGICPGAGIGNNRVPINKETMGVKVIAIGVPTVIAVPSIVNDSMGKMLEALDRMDAKKVLKKFTEEERYRLACEILEPYLSEMFVTPKNIDEAVKRISFIDEAVKRISYTISEAINQM